MIKSPLMKTISSIHRPQEAHWVGDGFPVQTVFHYGDSGKALTPFLLLDHAGPAEFAPTEAERGVGWHPHRGFETVSIAYEGAVDHEDSAGNRGSIGPGDVQWMTAGAGVLHKELHGRDFARQGGRFEMLQLWVNLPAKKKMTAPAYQTLLARDIPVVSLPEDAGSVRVIAGKFGGATGPARTFTPIDLLDVRLRAGARLRLDLRDGDTAALYVLKGKLAVADQGALVVFDRKGDAVEIQAVSDTTALVMSGRPIDEPIAGYGPFVMNTQQEIQQAIADLRNGRLGKIPALTE
jgi:redox-sensitive bicupin YhaK (pirin superfamily)